jgi:HAD superfamily hydrolase (TIGR01509 family)
MDLAAVVFDLDGVLIDSEEVWNTAREEVARANGGHWRADAQREMMGMSSTEWSRYMHDELGVDLEPQEISSAVVGRLQQLYEHRLPLLSGARQAVTRLARRWPLAVASSANRPIIDLVLRLAGMADAFSATVSSEEVTHGKPAPDVYLEAARRLAVAPRDCVAIEDSSNGLRSAAAAGMVVIAAPNREYPPSADALALAEAVVQTLDELTPALVERAASRREPA